MEATDADADRLRVREAEVIRAAVLVAIVLVSSVARAGGTADEHIARARDLHAKGDFVHARDELLAAYQLDPRPELLFALGQVEFNIGEYQAAIDYYQRFNATGPSAEQAALTQQAIGAARIKLDQPPPPPPPRRRHRHWDTEDWGLTAMGGLAITLGGGLLYDSHRLADNRTGSLKSYDARISEAHAVELSGIACAAAGVLAIGAAVVRWRLHLEDTVIEIHGSPSGASVMLERRL